MFRTPGFYITRIRFGSVSGSGLKSYEGSQAKNICQFP